MTEHTYRNYVDELSFKPNMSNLLVLCFCCCLFFFKIKIEQVFVIIYINYIVYFICGPR